MEGVVLDMQFFNPAIAAAGLAVLLAVALGTLLLSYIADEEAKGRQIDWFDEPLAVVGEPEKVQEIRFSKAA